MRRKEVIRLMAGFRNFRERYYGGEKPIYDKLSSVGQNPKTLIIACSDSRVDPAILTSAAPGELFVVRNVANLVPPYENAAGYHGVSSAIEFAVLSLKVENIIVLGHRQCGGIRVLMQDKPIGQFVSQWMRIAEPAKLRALNRFPDAGEDAQIRCCETESIVISLENLKTFPFVQEAIRERGLSLIGAYFDLEQGQLLELEDETGQFRALDINLK